MSQPPLTDIREMRKAITMARHRGERISVEKDLQRPSPASSLARNVLCVAERDGLSGEDAMTMLAYHALYQLEQSFDRELQFANLTPAKMVFDRAAYEAGTRLAKRTDDMVAAAITKHLGRNDWKLSELVGRLRRVTHQDHPEYEQFYLDSHLLCTINPARPQEWPQYETQDRRA